MIFSNVSGYFGAFKELLSNGFKVVNEGDDAVIQGQIVVDTTNSMFFFAGDSPDPSTIDPTYGFTISAIAGGAAVLGAEDITISNGFCDANFAYHHDLNGTELLRQDDKPIRVQNKVGGGNIQLETALMSAMGSILVNGLEIAAIETGENVFGSWAKVYDSTGNQLFTAQMMSVISSAAGALTAQFPIAWAQQVLNYKLLFDGAGGYVSVPDITLQGDFTLDLDILVSDLSVALRFINGVDSAVFVTATGQVRMIINNVTYILGPAAQIVEGVQYVANISRSVADLTLTVNGVGSPAVAASADDFHINSITAVGGQNMAGFLNNLNIDGQRNYPVFDGPNSTEIIDTLTEQTQANTYYNPTGAGRIVIPTRVLEIGETYSFEADLGNSGALEMVIGTTVSNTQIRRDATGNLEIYLANKLMKEILAASMLSGINAYAITRLDIDTYEFFLNAVSQGTNNANATTDVFEFETFYSRDPDAQVFPFTGVLKNVDLVDRFYPINDGKGATSISDILNLIVNYLSFSAFPNGLADTAQNGNVSVNADMNWGPQLPQTGFDFILAGVTNFAYKSYPILNSSPCNFSVFVEMTDGLPPVFQNSVAGAVTNDFSLTIEAVAATDPTTYLVEHVEASVYRVSVDYFSAVSVGNTIGVVKWSGNSNRTFKASGYQFTYGHGVKPYDETTSETSTNGIPVNFTDANWRIGNNGKPVNIVPTDWDGDTPYNLQGSLTQLPAVIELSQIQPTPGDELNSFDYEVRDQTGARVSSKINVIAIEAKT